MAEFYGIPKPIIKHHFYRKWESMKSRCKNKSVWNYKNYGGRGISYEPSWEHFSNFYKDMYESYSSCGKLKPTLDRIDNENNYSKNNCRWASFKEQNNNKRSNVKLEFNGEVKNMSEWASVAKVKPSTFRQRFYVYGWSMEKCLNQEVCHR